MRIDRLIAAVAIVGLVVLTSNVMALEALQPPTRGIIHRTVDPMPPGDHSGVPTISDACPAENVGVLADGDTIVGSTIGSTHDFGGDACDNFGGAGLDQIFEFSVGLPGEWSFDTCTVPACFDTNLIIREETGGGCPGDEVACDGDGCAVCYYDSLVQTFLVTGTTYYLIVDGWSTFQYGDFTVTVQLVVPGCASDADCDDGVFCNGTETCITATGQCVAPGNPCLTYEGYRNNCDEAAGACVKLDDNVVWSPCVDGLYFFPGSLFGSTNNAFWTVDDVQMSHHTTGVLEAYELPMISRANPPATNVGDILLVSMALWTVNGDGSCNPLAEIADSQCVAISNVAVSSTPPDRLNCAPAVPVQLPNNAGDFDRCEIDFFAGTKQANDRSGMPNASDLVCIGGPAGRDEFGQSIVWNESYAGGENWGATGYGEGGLGTANGVVNDWAEAFVLAVPGGSCCLADLSCSLTTEADCAAAGGEYGFTGTSNGVDGGCGGDPDGDNVFGRCGDNCPEVDNPGQGDCDGDGFGDACDPEGDVDKDGDGVCDGVDNCPNTSNPGQEDSDGDGAGDVCDPCPFDPFDDADGDGVCGDVDKCEGSDDRLDEDGDGVPDGCDQCPGSDDGIAGALDDDDGDGVLNCNDLCNGVDDAVFGPECEGRIPTVSEWGLVVLALLLLVAGKVYFGRRESLA